MPSRDPVISIPASTFGLSVGAQLRFGDLGRQADPWDSNAPLSGVYGRVGLGYFAPHAGNYYIADGFFSNPISGTQTYNSSTGVTTIDFKKASYSAGLSATVAGGYMFTPHFGAELGINVGLAPKTYNFQYDVFDSIGATYNDEYETRVNFPIYINPSLVIASGGRGAVQAYSRVGIVLPIGGKLTNTSTQTNYTTNTTYVEESITKFRTSKGLSGALGARYNLSSSLGLWGEVSGMALTRYAQSTETTKYTVNGVDQLSTLSVSQLQREYDYDLTIDPAAAPTTPTKAPVVSTPFSNFGVSIGAEFRF